MSTFTAVPPPLRGRMAPSRQPVWALLEHAFYPASLLLVAPLLLLGLGTRDFGLWMLVTALVGLAGVAGAGLGAAATTRTAALMARGESGQLQHQLSALAGIGGLAGAATAALILLSAPLTGVVEPGIAVGSASSWLTVLVGATAMSCAMLEVMALPAIGAIKGAGRFDLAARIEVLSRGGVLAVALLSAAGGQGIAPVLLAMVVAALVRVLLAYGVVRRLCGLAALRPALNNPGAVLALAGWGGLQGLGGTLVLHADRIVLGSTVSVEAVALYTVVLMLPAQVHGVVAALNGVLFPQLARLAASGQMPKARLSLLRATLFNTLIGSLLAVCMLMAEGPVLALLTGGLADSEMRVVFRTAVLFYWLLTLSVAGHYALLGMQAFRTSGLLIGSAGLANVLAAYLWIPDSGLFGAVQARVVFAVIVVGLAPAAWWGMHRASPAFYRPDDPSRVD